MCGQAHVETAQAQHNQTSHVINYLINFLRTEEAINCSLGMPKVGHVSSKIAVSCAYCKRDSSLADKKLSLCTEELLTYALCSSMVHKQVSYYCCMKRELLKCRLIMADTS